MQKNAFLRDTMTVYALFLSGILFYGVRIDSETFLSGLFGMTLCFLILYALCRFSCTHTLSDGKMPIWFSCAAVLLCLYSASSLFYSLADEMPRISDTLSGKQFSHFFWILSIVLCLYITKDKTVALSRLCLLLLPFLLFPTVLAWFSFLGYEGNLPYFTPESRLILRPSYFRDGSALFGAVLLYFAVRDGRDEKEKQTEKSGGRAFAAAFVLFVFTFFAEKMKLLLFFGSHGAAALPRPDRTLTALIPYINIQDVFLFVYYFSFMLRLSIAVCGIQLYAEKLSESLNLPERPFWRRLLTGTAVYGGFLLFNRFPVLNRYAFAAPPILLAAGLFLFSARRAKKRSGTAK